MKLSVNGIIPGCCFEIIGTSYIGTPKSNTAMFITKKIEQLLPVLESVNECLVFAEAGIDVPRSLLEKHAFSFSEHPQLDYAKFANRFAYERFLEEKKLVFALTSEGYYVSSDVQIPDDAYIEPNCVIGPDVQMGKNAKIYTGAVIRRSTIGDNFVANENAVVGANGFTMTDDENGKKVRIPTLGRVIIGDQVEVGTNNNISCGSGGDTIIDNNVKLDAMIHIGHDVHLHENVEITAGVTVSGFVDVGKNVYIGVGAVLRNRITIGEHAFIGMGSNVTKSIANNAIVAGNPAKPFNKNKGL